LSGAVIELVSNRLPEHWSCVLVSAVLVWHLYVKFHEVHTPVSGLWSVQTLLITEHAVLFSYGVHASAGLAASQAYS
jgi:hypothetical protein